MAVVNSSTFNFAEVVQKALKEWGLDVVEEMFEGLDEVSKETVRKLRQASRDQFGSGKYASGWTRTLEKKRLYAFATIHGNSPTYKLAHLLEYGHVTRNGTGRTFPSTPAYEHIAPINEWAQDEAVDRIISKLEARR